MESVKRTLLGQMEALRSSNQRLQEDLICSRYQLEEQAVEIDHVRREARTDGLTGVNNRKSFDEKLHLLLSAWERERQPFVLILIDLDHFKRINDAHGHPGGDSVLEKVGTWLREWAREGDFVARYGGDEFAMLLPHADLQVGMDLAESIRAGTADRASRVSLKGHHVSISLSMGVASPRQGDTTATILQRADSALYKSKGCGRNQVRGEDVLPPPVPPAIMDEPCKTAVPAET